jgi:uncharacterized membrane protein
MILLPIHIIAAVVALGVGYVALFSAKGAALHRRAGMLFVYAMVVMSLTAAYLAAITSVRSSLIAGLPTFYFVMTGMLTMRQAATPRWLHAGGAVVALVVGVLAFGAARDMAALRRPEAAPLMVFGVMALAGVAGDVRMLRRGGIEGKRRIKRHLWRMCFAMWVAAASFFWGPPNRVPELLRYPLIFPIPVLAPIAMMVYWLWRVRARKPLRGIYDRTHRAEAHVT